MKFWEAMKLLEEGKKIRCCYWNKSHKWDKWTLLDPQLVWSDCSYRVARMMDEDWELYEEAPKNYRIWDLIPALKEGKNIGRKNGQPKIKPYGNPEPFLIHVNEPLSFEDLEADDWRPMEGTE